MPSVGPSPLPPSRYHPALLPSLCSPLVPAPGLGAPGYLQRGRCPAPRPEEGGVCFGPSGLGGAVAAGGGSAIAKASSVPALSQRCASRPASDHKLLGRPGDKGAARGGSGSGGGGGGSEPAGAGSSARLVAGALRPGLAAG